MEIEKLEPEQKPREFDAHVTLGKVEFKNVTMSYKEGLNSALRNCSFKVDCGTRVAVVGRTGAGKSTIF